MGSHEQSERKSPEKSGSTTVSKKVAEIWEQMNKGLPDKRLNFVSQSSTAFPTQNSANNVRFLHSLFLFFLFFVILSSGILNVVFLMHRIGKSILAWMQRRRITAFRM